MLKANDTSYSLFHTTAFRPYQSPAAIFSYEINITRISDMDEASFQAELKSYKVVRRADFHKVYYNKKYMVFIPFYCNSIAT